MLENHAFRTNKVLWGRGDYIFYLVKAAVYLKKSRAQAVI